MTLMMEDIVLLVTIMAKTNAEVFCLKFNIGEFDMVKSQGNM